MIQRFKILSFREKCRRLSVWHHAIILKSEALALWTFQEHLSWCEGDKKPSAARHRSIWSLWPDLNGIWCPEPVFGGVFHCVYQQPFILWALVPHCCQTPPLGLQRDMSLAGAFWWSKTDANMANHDANTGKSYQNPIQSFQGAQQYTQIQGHEQNHFSISTSSKILTWKGNLVYRA